MKNLRKLFALLLLVSFVPNVSAKSFSEGETFYPTDSSSGGGGTTENLSITPIYSNALKLGQINTLTSSLITHEGYQYAGLWDQSHRLVLCKRATDEADWDCVVYNGTPYTATFTGTGLDDLTAGGTNTNATSLLTYDVEIDATGGTDTFKWRVNGGSYTTGVNCAITASTLSNGLTVVFGAITGHTVGDKWTFTVNPLVAVTGDLHQSITMAFDNDDILHVNTGTYVSEGGVNYRRATSANSIDSLTAEQTIDATYDAEGSYLTFINDVNGELFAFYRSNGASGQGDEFLWKYDTTSDTWARAAGTRSSGVPGSFIDGNTAVRSAYMAIPVVTADNFIHFAWSWQNSTATYGVQRQTNISYVKYDATNGAFYKADDTSQTVPITLSNDDSVYDEPAAINQGVGGLAYTHALDIDSSGNPNVVMSKNSGAAHSITFVGSGTNDLLPDYRYPVINYETQPKYEIVVTGTSSPNQFKYRINGGAYVTLNNMSTKPVALNGGLRVAFKATTGHTLNDAWTIYPPNGYNQLYRVKHNGSTWDAAQQLTNTVDNDRTSNTNNVPWGDGIAKRPSLFFDGSTAYILYGSISTGNGLMVLKTSDWSTFSNFSIQPFNTNDVTDSFTGTIDLPAWNASKKFYFIHQVNPSGVTSGYSSFHQSPASVFYWNPSEGGGFRPQTLTYLNSLGDLWLGSVLGAVRVAGQMNQPDAHVFWAQNTDDLNDIITNRAVSGDTIYLASGTYTLKDPLKVTKAVNLIGQGIGKTTIATSLVASALISVTVSNASIRNLSVSSTAAGTIRGIDVNGTAGATLSGVVIDNVETVMSGTGTQIGIEFQDAGGTVKDHKCSATSSSGAALCFYSLGSSSQETAATVNIINPMGTSSGTSGIGGAFKVQSNSAATLMTNNFYGGYGIGTGSGGTRDGIEVTGGANALANVYGTVLNGTTYDAASSSAGSVLNMYNPVLVNNLTLATGTLTQNGTWKGNNVSLDGTFVSAATGALGWTPVAGANTACNTTCTNACVAGLDAGASAFLACTDATADSCLCAGAS